MHAQPTQENDRRFPVLPSNIDPRDETFQRNYQANSAALERLTLALAMSREGGGPRAVQRHLQAGKLLPRQRIELLLDRDAHFLELCPLAGYEVEHHRPGAGIIGGIGVVSGVEVLISANEATIKGGAIGELGVRKTNRLAEIAEENRLPTLNLVESAGADLPHQARIFIPGGRSFRDITRRSAQRIPSICLVFGSATAGGAYLPGMSDYVVMVKDQACVHLAGPPLLKMATGEIASAEELGGADMHSRLSGVSDYLAEDERDAIRIGRELVAHLNWRKHGPPPLDDVEQPVHDPDDLLGIASADLKIPFAAREVIARLVDGSRFSPFKPLYGSSLACGWARIHGFPVGILANDGVLFSASANKGAQFIQLCNQAHTPLIFLQNITGFMVGKTYEQEGIVKNGAKLINAVSNSTVPAITVMMGASFGAGNYGMAGRAYAPRFVFTWPNHQIAVMGGEQLAGTLALLEQQSASRKGVAIEPAQTAQAQARIRERVAETSSPFYATAHLWDDGIIDPRDTRTILAISLSAIHTNEVVGTTSWGVFRH